LLRRAIYGAIGGRGAAAPAGTWQTVLNPTLTTNATGYSGKTIRQIIPATILSDVSGTKIRLTLQFGNNGAIVDKMYIGKRGPGDAYDFDGGQVQLFVGGSATYSFAANTPTLTDEATFSSDGTTNLVLAIYYSGLSDIKYVATAGATNYQINGDDAATTDTTGYASNGNILSSVDLIEVYG